jgi:hypothetical protein
MRDVNAKAVCRAGRNRRYRARRRRGQFCANVLIDGSILDFLQKSGWLSQRDSHDAEKVGEAIARCLEASSRI